MKECRRSFFGQEFRLREYDRGGLVIDGIIRKLAHHRCDDYCNPPQWAWAALIFEPLKALESIVWRPKELWPPLTPKEREFLSQVMAAIVKVGKTVEVSYFSSASEAWESWLKLKGEAEQCGYERRSG